MGKNNNKKTYNNENHARNNRPAAGGSMKNVVENAIHGKEITGTVKWYDIKKGYGFITADDGSEYFMHYTGIANGRTYTAVEQGDKVKFNLIPGEDESKGPQATGIVVTSYNSKPLAPVKAEAEDEPMTEDDSAVEAEEEVESEPEETETNESPVMNTEAVEAAIGAVESADDTNVEEN